MHRRRERRRRAAAEVSRCGAPRPRLASRADARGSRVDPGGDSSSGARIQCGSSGRSNTHLHSPSRLRAWRYRRPMNLAYPDPELTDGVVRLRPWIDGDLDCVREAGLDPRIPAGTTVQPDEPGWRSACPPCSLPRRALPSSSVNVSGSRVAKASRWLSRTSRITVRAGLSIWLCVRSPA
jgi:hypothetical protein